MKKTTYNLAMNIAKKITDLFIYLSCLHRFNDADKIYGLLESMETIVNNPCALKAWGIKAKRIIKEVK